MQSGRWLCYRLRVERVSVGRPRLWRLAKYSDFGHGHSMRCPDQPVVEVKVAKNRVQPANSLHAKCFFWGMMGDELVAVPIFRARTTFAVPLRSEHGPCRHDLRDSVDSR